MRYENPVIRGFNPDPSICRVGDDFFVATSTFEYFPGLPIYHSKNLVDWELINHGISRPSQLKLSTAAPNALGLYAPTLRYINERFYLICTNVGGPEGFNGNFIVWTDDIYSEWSDPIWLDLPGIDPSLFIDDDGKIYYTGTHEKIYLCEIDLETGATGSLHDIWTGTGGRDPEGPHIYKKDGFYYLMISEGGTTYEHMITMARSESICGPYEAFENNPVLTNRSLSSSIRAVGHADLVQDQNQNWWAVCLGIRVLPKFPVSHILGRETSVLPVKWDEGAWPVFGKHGSLATQIEANLPAELKESLLDASILAFDSLHWTYLFSQNTELVQIESKELVKLYGNEANLDDQAEMAWFGFRQDEFHFSTTVCLDFDALDVHQEFGLTVFLNAKHHYEIAVKRFEKSTKVILKQRIGPLSAVIAEEAFVGNEVVLRLVGSPQSYQFFYGKSPKELILLGEGVPHYLSTEVGGSFTGNFIALYASGNGKISSHPIRMSKVVHES
ncbi:glycoside hydrolase family 43 protein [Fundicoccus sp. Sow4_H7]|uniref:glycoside hydrolase family 43 protein n=1 Tax=Fundicoccus sp. Sow4_H7 TaxID=3438784 RepID=UPI003F8DBB4E